MVTVCDMELTLFKKLFLLVLPVILTLSTALVFGGAARVWGDDLGYLAGFGCYWLWCWGVPIAYGGKGLLREILAQDAPLLQKKNWLLVGILLLTVLGALWMYFIPSLPTVSFWVVMCAPITIVNGISEELLWRGLYVQVFRRDVFWGCVYPAMGFALSHISPERVYPAEGGVVSFILSTFFLGLAYGWVAYKTGSAKWTAIAHSIIGLLAFGQPLSTSLARLIFE